MRLRPTDAAPPARTRNVSLSELAPLLLLALIIVAFTLTRIKGAVAVYFPVDAAHYNADADALLGRGVRANLHPLLFPALLALPKLWLGPIVAYTVAITVVLLALPIALYTLLRQWLRPEAALVGAAAGTLTPAVAEVLGWAGGATLAATVVFAFTVAAMEWWSRAGGRQGFLVGLGLALALNGHPFVALVTGLLIGSLWLATLLTRGGGAATPWGPARWRGPLSVALPLVLGVALAIPYYSRISGEGGALHTPDFSVSWTLLRAMSRENEPLLLALVLAAVPLALLARRPRAVLVAGFLLALVLVFPALTDNHVSFLARPLYFTPVLIALSGGFLVGLLGRALGEGARTARWSGQGLLFAAPVALLMVFVGGYAERLTVASRFYAVLNDDSDVRLVERLADSSGAISTSWYGVQYDVGATAAWVVEGLARKPAAGPGAAWVSTIKEGGDVAAALQRFFAGQFGIENDALQLAGSAVGSKRDPAIQARVDDYFYPLIFLDHSLGDFPFPVQNASGITVGERAIAIAFQGSEERTLRQTVALAGDAATLTYQVEGGEGGPWSLWLWDAFGRFTTLRASEPGQLTFTRRILGRDVRYTLALDPAQGELVYHERDPRFGLSATEARLTATSEAQVTLRLLDAPAAGPVVGFSQEDYIRRYQISDVLVWKDSGALPLFEQSVCFRLTDESTRLRRYTVQRAACGLDRESAAP